MSQTNVTIKIDIDAKTGAIDRIRGELAALAAQAELVDKRFADISDSSSKLNRNFVDLDKEVRRKDEDFANMSKSVDKTSKSLDKNSKQADKNSKGWKKFGDIFKKVLGFAFKGFLISFAASAASLVAINLAMKAGGIIAKGYKASLSGLFQVVTTAGAAAITVLAALAAGQREYAAALSSSKYIGAQRGALYEATAQMRSLTSNTDLAVLGSEALQAAFAGINKNAKMTGGMATSMTAMGDFIATAGDPKKAAAAAGEFLGLLSKEGKLSSNVVKAAAAVGPEFEKAVKEASKKGMSTSGAFLTALVGGELSGAVEGQLQRVNDTLFGTAKRNFQLIKEQFADFGQPLLNPFTDVLNELGKIFQRTFMSISGVVNAFAKGKMTDGLVSAADKFGYWISKIFNEYLPKAGGMFDRLRSFWDDLNYGFTKMADWMRPLAEGGQVLLDVFGPALKSIFEGFVNGLGDLSKVLLDNKDDLLSFGNSIAGLFTSIGDVFGGLKQAVIQVVPVLTTISNILTVVASVVAQVLGLFNSMGGLGSFAALAGMGYGYKKLGDISQSKTGSRGGGIIDRIKGATGIGTPQAAQVMNVTAATVNLTGPVVGGGAGGGVIPAGGGGGGGGGGGNTPLGRGEKAKNWFKNNGTMLAAVGLPIIGGLIEEATGNYGGLDAGGAGTLASLGVMTKGFGLGGLTAPGMTTPMGTAGPVAIAAGGYMAGSVASNALLGSKRLQERGTMTQQAVSVGGSIAAGAATGAIIGNFIPIPGVGAAVGAVIGGIAGGIAGWMNKGKNEKASKKVAEEFTGDYQSAIEEAIGRGDVRGAQKLEAEMLRMKDSMAATTPDVEAFNKKFDGAAEEINAFTTGAATNFEKNIKLLSKTTGLTTDRVEELATEMGMNLTGTIEDVNKAVADLLKMPEFKTGAEVQSYMTTGLAGIVTNILQRPQQREAAMQAVNQAGQVLAESQKEGIAPTEGQVSAYLQTAFSYEMSMGKTAAEALTAVNAQIGKGGRLYKEGGRFEGMENTQMASFLESQLGAIVTEYGKTGEGTLSAGLIATMVAQNPKLDNATITANLERIMSDPASSFSDKVEAMALITDTSAKSLTTSFDKFNSEIMWAGTVLENAFRGIIITTPPSATNPSGPAGASGPAGTPPSNTQPTPSNPGGASGPVGPDGDTRSPRFGMKNSIGVFNALNSSTFGKRTITSGVRNFNLGSINSDHTTGRALDLTGQNLGAYATAMKGMGGFAEFHGIGGERHLHTVAPDATGDTAAPISSMSSAANSNTTSNQYNISIAPSQNASAQEIADAVMQRIYREQRSARERQ